MNPQIPRLTTAISRTQGKPIPYPNLGPRVAKMARRWQLSGPTLQYVAHQSFSQPSVWLLAVLADEAPTRLHS